MHSVFINLLTVIALLGQAVMGCECRVHAMLDAMASHSSPVTDADRRAVQSPEHSDHDCDHPECVYRVDPNLAVDSLAQWSVPQLMGIVTSTWLPRDQATFRQSDLPFPADVRATAARSQLQVWTV